MNRTAVHEAGHALAAQQHGFIVTDIIVDDDLGECRFSGRPLLPDSLTWVSLAGPAAERFFFGEPDDDLADFGGMGDLNTLPSMDLAEYMAWDAKVSLWVKYNADAIVGAAR